MHDRRPTRRLVCVVAALPLALAACAGHTAPPTRDGDIERPATATTATSAIAALTKAGATPATARSLPSKLLIGVKLDQPLTSARPEGFAFSTRVAEPVTAKDGAVAIPAGTIIRGVVTAIRPASGAKSPAICLKLDYLELAGRSYGILSSVKNVLVNDKAATIFSHDSLATVFASSDGFPIKGTAIALPSATAGEPAELPAGTVIVVELDSALTIPR